MGLASGEIMIRVEGGFCVTIQDDAAPIVTVGGLQEYMRCAFDYAVVEKIILLLPANDPDGKMPHEAYDEFGIQRISATGFPITNFGNDVLVLYRPRQRQLRQG